MEDFILKLAAHTGISQDQAKKVATFVSEHIHEFPQLLERAKLADRLPSGLADKLKL